MQNEQGLVERGLLPDVDFCRHAVRLGDGLPDPAHVRACPVCLRRWRVSEAALQGWVPMSHRQAIALVPRMAAGFSSAERPAGYSAFYAHLAGCRRCESALADLTVDLPPPPPAGRDHPGVPDLSVLP